ncbi:unnamed protein product [Brassica rapa subsp. narinosa]|uniref:(rape) hypothetical protein n=1 Tax=Brassica napus TaxID=3708 RepID=A0A816S552_BRANA|nr:unnamed protein product [Brassica napus]
MAGVSSLQQASDPPDPGADNHGSGSSLHPSQFPPLPLSPEAASKPQVTPPILPSSPWGVGKMDTLRSPDNRSTTIVNQESFSMTMDISPTIVPIQISEKGLRKLQVLPSAKTKEIDCISAQYTTLPAKTKGSSPPTAAILFGTVANPRLDITTQSTTASESSKDLPPATRPEIVLNPCFESKKVTPSLPDSDPPPTGQAKTSGPAGPAEPSPTGEANSRNLPRKDPQASGNSSKPPPSDSTYAGKAKMGTDRSLERLAPDKGKGHLHPSSSSAKDDAVAAAASTRDSVITADCYTPFDKALERTIFSKDTLVAIPFSPAIVSHEGGPQVLKPFINVSSSKKRKGSHLSRRSSPESTGGTISANLFSEISLANPFSLLEPRNLGHLSATGFSFSIKEPDGQSGDSVSVTAIVLPEGSSTPVEGSSPPGGRNTKNL